MSYLGRRDKSRKICVASGLRSGCLRGGLTFNEPSASSSVQVCQRMRSFHRTRCLRQSGRTVPGLAARFRPSGAPRGRCSPGRPRARAPVVAFDPSARSPGGGFPIGLRSRQLLFQSATLRFKRRQVLPSLPGCLGEDRLEAPWVLAQLRDLLHHDPLHLTGGNGLALATVVAPLLRYRADVIAITLAALGGVSWRSRRAGSATAL
jgi:hypothetical protein